MCVCGCHVCDFSSEMGISLRVFLASCIDEVTQCQPYNDTCHASPRSSPIRFSSLPLSLSNFCVNDLACTRSALLDFHLSLFAFHLSLLLSVSPLSETFSSSATSTEGPGSVNRSTCLPPAFGCGSRGPATILPRPFLNRVTLSVRLL